MQKYKFHTKKSDESIGVTTASSSEEAAKIFAKIKVLNLNNFLDLYEVSKVKN